MPTCPLHGVAVTRKCHRELPAADCGSFHDLVWTYKISSPNCHTYQGKDLHPYSKLLHLSSLSLNSSYHAIVAARWRHMDCSSVPPAPSCWDWDAGISFLSTFWYYKTVSAVPHTVGGNKVIFLLPLSFSERREHYLSLKGSAMVPSDYRLPSTTFI